MIFDSPPHYEQVNPGPSQVSKDAFILADAMAIGLVTPKIKGATLTRFERRVLFKNCRTDADTRLMKPGWYLHNTKHGIHGYYNIRILAPQFWSGTTANG